MDKAEIIRTVNRVLAREFELDEAALTPTARFGEDLGLDSLDAVDMVVVLEQAFKVRLRGAYAADKIRTLGDLYGFIEDLTQNSKLKTQN
ncbi:MAG: phosphopantetheine-binding protein [Verrucomicrobiales bacterium]|jgi:acyl carrier protein|nr:phosphopantetheine-binding protein [Verrucomicrobiales bacterium]